MPCIDFARSYNLTLAQLVSLNPWVLADCSGLYANLESWKYRSVCVGAHSSTSTAISSPAPTQSGMTSGCLRLYTAVTGDSCSSIQDTFSITFVQFLGWNPAIKSDCSLLIIGNAYCVSGPTSTTSVTATTSAPATAPTQTGIAASCSQYYIAKSGDGCSSITSAFGISFAQFYAWNPAVGDDCQNLWLDTTYCVAAPAQSGTISSCTKYYVTKSGDGCASIQAAFGITFAQFYSWNPAVGSGCANLWLDTTYCVAAPSTATTVSSVTPPAPTQTGIVANCNKYTVVPSGESQ